VAGACGRVRSDQGVLASPAPEPVTFNRQIAPIVFQHCAPCHRSGEAGPFSLLSYADVRKRARQIARATADRYMPPWLPEPGYGEFVGGRRLSDEEVDLLQRWVREGAPEGPPAEAPGPPRFTEGWQLGAPDLVVEMRETYTVPAEGGDVFRNFVLPVPVKEVRSWTVRGPPGRATRATRGWASRAWTSSWSRTASSPTATSCSGSPAPRR
jgi:hypothetical protein